MIRYEYAEGDLLDRPNTYQYTSYQGQAFVVGWAASRQQVLACLPTAKRTSCINLLNCKTAKLLKALIDDLDKGQVQSQPLSYWLPRLIKKFEVSKRLYTEYDDFAPHRPVEGSNYQAPEIYLLFAECLLLHPNLSGDTRLINCLLKLCDTLCSIRHQFQEQTATQLAWILENEYQIIQQLQQRIGL